MENKVLYHMSEIAISNNTPRDFNYFIVSFDALEPRSWNALYKIAEKKVFIKKIIVLVYGSIIKSEVKSKIEETFHKNVGEILIYSCKKIDYRLCFEKVRELMEGYSNKDIVGVDITNMPTPQYFLLIKWLSRKIKKVFIYYTQPERYIMHKGLFKSYFSTVGPVSVDEIDGFTGISANDNEGNRLLVCMLGFDNDLLPIVIQEAGPHRIVAINGFPSFFPKFKDISLTNNQRILSGSDYVSLLEKNKKFSDYTYVEANNPFEAYNTLNEIVTDHKSYCVDIVPLGTKPMALGACLYAINDRNVRVIFPVPEMYAENFTQKSKKTMEYIVNFDN